MYQPDAAEALCRAANEAGLHVAMETCGFAPEETIRELAPLVDIFLFDYKLTDPELHKQYTGVSNELILKNFATLSKSQKDFVIRTPLIPTVTDTEENTRAIAELLFRNNVKYIEFLPYNKMAGAKYTLAGQTYEPSFDETAPVHLREDILKEYEIKYRII